MMLKITSNATGAITYATHPTFIKDTLLQLARKAHALHSVTITVERVTPLNRRTPDLDLSKLGSVTHYKVGCPHCGSKMVTLNSVRDVCSNERDAGCTYVRDTRGDPR